MEIKVKQPFLVSSCDKRVSEAIKFVDGTIAEELPTRSHYSLKLVLCDGITERIFEIQAADIVFNEEELYKA